MRSTIAIAISTLALGTALASVPAFAQTSGPANGGGTTNGGTSGCIRFQTSCSDTPYPMNGAAAGGSATQQQGQYNAQQREQRTGSAANTQRDTQRLDRRSAALGSEGRDQNGGGPYYNYYSGPSFAGGPESGAVAACEARYRSYDPATGTYLGFDGTRHACP